MNLFRRKSVTDLQAEALTDQSLKRALGPLNLTALGVGAIIGTGIFVLTGTVAAQNAGPAVVLSFVLAGIASIFAALCYSEFASLVPMAGSAYTYGYATLGELFAWIIGWDLILEYAVGAITVAIGWSGYVVSFLHDFGITVPPELSAARGTQLIEIPAALAVLLKAKAGWTVLSPGLLDAIKAAGTDPAMLGQVTALFNLPAVLIIFVVTTLLVVGIKESANFNNLIVCVKVAVVLLFIFGAFHAITAANWHPFIPANTGTSGHFGWSGVMTGAGIVFFAYIGFDAVSTAAQEAKNPQRDMPIGIIGSLLVCTVLYILVSGIATGIVPYQQLDVPDPIAVAADRAGMGWMGRLIKLGAIAGLSSVILVMLLGQSRVFYSMARDGLLPPFVSAVHPKFRTPWIGSIVTGVGVAIFAAVFNVREAGSLCSIGTLLAFVIVSVGILVLRVREFKLPRKFTTPLIWYVAPMGALSALTLMAALPWPTWRRLLIWFAIGIVFYFLYSIRHSRLRFSSPSRATSQGLDERLAVPAGTRLLKALFSFSGRVGRERYWELALWTATINFLFLPVVISQPWFRRWFDDPAENLLFVIPLALLALAAAILFSWISLSIQVRRCHDRGKSGWFLLVAFIPIIGLLWSLVELGFHSGDSGRNQFGEAPSRG